MSVWVVNASPLILLGKINQLPLLAQLADQVVIPHEVADEIKAGPPDDPARLWLQSAGRDLVSGPTPLDLRVVAWDLGKGETAVISRALGEPGAVGVLDDRAARDCAQLFGAGVKGTVGVLLLAKQAGLITAVRPEIQGLLRAGALLDGAVVREALNLASESQTDDE
jgi:predicted nucleic acid-binding protein